MTENTNVNVTPEKNEVVVATPNNTPVNNFADEGFNLIVDMESRQLSYASMSATTPEEKAKLFNAMNNPDKRLGDCINMKIRMKDLFVEIVNCTNTETGEITACPRIVVIDDKGIGYQCVSVGIYSALKKLIQVYGAPTWETPVTVEVKQVTKGDRKMLTLNVVA